MGRVCSRRFLGYIFTMMFVFLAISPALATASLSTQNELNTGPYVDRVIYNLIPNEDQRILSLRAGSSHILSNDVSSHHIPQLESESGVALSNSFRNGYGHITIKCAKYPFNISAFRKAFAYSFNKTHVKSELLATPIPGIVAQEHDSVVPYSNSWCIEDELPGHYYESRVATGATILDNAGFTIDSGTGYRLAPDGSHFTVSIQWTDMEPVASAVGTIVTQAAINALTALDINATSGPIWPHLDNLTDRIDNNQDFDMAFYAYNFPDTNVDWLGYLFWGELADVSDANPCNFRNESYDSWRTKLLQSNDFDEVYEAAAMMQRILHENVPLVVAYQNVYTQAFRTDLFTGHLENPLLGFNNPWTYRKLQRVNGSSGGTVAVAIGSLPNSFNIYLAKNTEASQILAQLWPSLYLKGPDLEPVPYLATDMKRETHSDNPSVQEGHTRFTIDIVQDAIWTDGTPLTAEDVTYSFNYSVESRAYGNPAGDSLTNFVSAYAPSTYRAVIEFDSESYWHFSHFAYDYIIPKHVFENIGYSGWNSWNPVYNTTEPYVTAGPFRFEQYHVVFEFFEISANPDFWFYPSTAPPLPPVPPIIPVAIITGVAVIGLYVVSRKVKRR